MPPAKLMEVNPILLAGKVGESKTVKSRGYDFVLIKSEEKVYPKQAWRKNEIGLVG